uniref:Hyposin-H3 n=1 Tax=Pithecopus azureus TaxID=2034991 RepID=HPS3_PITAZ|nr:RecName: Full=Hyposin-H3; Short=HPS-H3; AltName: Full=Hyposin-5; AltName: Full=Hyposin-HA5 [Pithecopus azureus]
LGPALITRKPLKGKP